MKIVVITGSTRGIGYGLADSFLALGCGVIVSGRALASVEQAVARLSSKYDLILAAWISGSIMPGSLIPRRISGSIRRSR